MYKDKKIGVFGLGISGISTIKYLKAKGANFIAYDDNDKTISDICLNYPELYNNLKNLSDVNWEKIDYLILSPGIALEFPSPHKVVQIAKKADAKIICDIELLYLENPNNFFIGVTGTNGKSTTTALITHILKSNHIDAVAVGNIGTPVFDIKFNSDTIFVIEASSFQLDLLDKTKFNIAILLNITPDHLDRHGNIENYTKSKYKIFTNQSEKDFAIIHSSLKSIKNSASFCSDDIKNYTIANNNSLVGLHNKENLAAAIACCLKYGLKIEETLKPISSFVGLKHRMQYLKKHNGVTFINDSKATNADSTSKALASFDNIIWIVGGVKKEGGISSLESFFFKVKQALLIGKSSDEFAITLGNKVNWQKCTTLKTAFDTACKIAKEGDVVLLSPACASYDQWKNFEQRGEAFIDMVRGFVKQ